MRFVHLAFIAALTLPAFAQDAPSPRVRPEEPAAEAEAAPEAEASEPEAGTSRGTDAETPAAGTGIVPLPRERPDPEAEAAPAEGEKAEEPGEAEEPARPAEPPAGAEPPAEPEPPRIYQTACPALLSGRVQAKALPPIEENQCREQSPLSVTGVFANGRSIPFSGEAVLNCGMATVLPDWAEAVDSYLMARENTRIKSISVGTSYMCRPRNRAEGADVSEHGFANALDVVGFVLEDGRTVTLSEGWADALSPEGRLLRFAHDAGCARFSTTLGPEANALHADHLHFDLGCHGEACTARLCE